MENTNLSSLEELHNSREKVIESAKKYYKMEKEYAYDNSGENENRLKVYHKVLLSSIFDYTYECTKYFTWKNLEMINNQVKEDITEILDTYSYIASFE